MVTTFFVLAGIAVLFTLIGTFAESVALAFIGQIFSLIAGCYFTYQVLTAAEIIKAQL